MTASPFREPLPRPRLLVVLQVKSCEDFLVRGCVLKGGGGQVAPNVHSVGSDPDTTCNLSLEVNQIPCTASALHLQRNCEDVASGWLQSSVRLSMGAAQQLIGCLQAVHVCAVLCLLACLSVV
jgi:hypothetical protein